MKELPEKDRADQNDNHLHAYSIKLGKNIFITEAERGKKGYLCIGCKNEMVAAIGEKNRPYFRHEAKDVPFEKRCTFSDETYRHQVAKTILQRLKKVKVPALYKYPPMGEGGLAYKIRDAIFIEAFEVHNERCFFENEAGEIEQGIGAIDDESSLFIRPDVTFFDKEGNPILFIELVATHKVSDEKKVIYNRMGIDTIQVSIPKDSEEAIEQVFSNTNHTKWIYNHEETNTLYISISNRNREGFSIIDGEQRRIFEESYSCRKVGIANLIRSINKCLSSEQYSGVERAFRDEIFRIENLTEEFRNEQQDIRDGIDQKYRERRERIKKERIRIAKEEREFEDSYRIRIEKETGLAESDITAKIEEEDRVYRDLEKRYLHKAGEIETEQDSIDTEIRRVDIDITRIPRESEILRNRIEATHRSIAGLPNVERRTTESIAAETESIKSEMAAISEIEFKFTEEGIQRDRDDIRIKFEREEREVENQYIEEERRITRIVKERNFSGNDEFTSSCKKFFNELESFTDWHILEGKRRRIEKARTCISTRRYKDWHE